MQKDELTKHWANKSVEIIASYWDSEPARKRSKWFVDWLRNFEFDSIFEVGFFSGRNLKYINEAFVGKKIGGIEVNPKAVIFARDRLPNVKLGCMDLHDLDRMSEKYDIVFTMGVLIHIPPSELGKVAKKMLERTNKYLIHIESFGSNELIAGTPDMRVKPKYKYSDQIQYAPNIRDIYKRMGYNCAIIDLPEGVKTNGASQMIVIKKIGK